MIVLGERYHFMDMEMQKLQKKFQNIAFVPYKEKDAYQVIEDIKSKLKEEPYKLIVLNTKAPVPDELIQYLTDLELDGIKFLTIEHFLEKYLHKVFIPKDNSDISFLDNIKPFSPWQYFQKRVVDFCVVIPLGIITLPVILYATYRIKKESPDGEIFFKQTRVGKNGKSFTCYKFRSMRTDIEFFDHYTQEDDPRIFPWGETMRKTRIDELPQLLNVLKGELHLIGPRAEWNELAKKYEEHWPFYHTRHLVHPGITGWAQVNYPYGKCLEDTYQKLMYDLYYIKNWSLWLEIKTALQTALVMVGKKGH